MGGGGVGNDDGVGDVVVVNGVVGNGVGCWQTERQMANDESDDVLDHRHDDSSVTVCVCVTVCETVEKGDGKGKMSVPMLVPVPVPVLSTTLSTHSPAYHPPETGHTKSPDGPRQ